LKGKDLNEDKRKEILKLFNVLFEDCKEIFLRHVEFSYNVFYWSKLDSQKNWGHTQDIKDMEMAFKKTMRCLKEIYNFKKSIPLARDFSLKGSQILIANMDREHTVRKAFEAYNILENLCRVIEYYKKPKRGRGAPGLRGSTTHLASELAQTYYEQFCLKPTTTREGDFSKIFNEVMKIFNQGTGQEKSPDKISDYSRAIRAAIQNLKTIDKKRVT